ncbi:oligosaccharide flippase family protein, partial [Bacteroidota bacterium]
MVLGKYVNNISGLQFFNLLRYGTLLLIGIIFTKTDLSLSDIGYYHVLLLIAAAVSSFWLSGIIQSLLPLYKNNKTFSSKEEDNKKSAELFNAFLLLCLFSVAAAFFVFIFQNFLSRALNNSETIPFLNLLLLFILFNGPASLVEYIYLLKRQPEKIIKYGLISFILQFVVVAGPAILGYNIEICICGLVLINVIRFAWLIKLLFRNAEFKISFKFIKEHLTLGTPLILSIFLSGSATYIDGFIILNKFDSEKFAVFSYGARELPLVVLLANAFSVSMISEFKGDNLNDLLKKIKNKSIKIARYLFPVSIVLLATSKWFFPRIFNPEFAESAVIFNIYLLLIVSRLVFPQTILIGLKKTKIILLASAFEILLNVFFSLLLINYFGIAGVAIATVIAYYFEKIFLILYNHYYLKISPV